MHACAVPTLTHTRLTVLMWSLPHDAAMFIVPRPTPNARVPVQVVSNRMQKTAVVAVHYALWVSKYKVYQKRVSRHKAHDEQEVCSIGDVVRIQSTR
jgi:ribosomal protein S17